MKVTQNLKNEIARYSAALSVLNHTGDIKPGMQALQLDNLTAEQVKHGLVTRLTNAVNHVRMFHRRVARADMDLALTVLRNAGHPID